MILSDDAALFQRSRFFLFYHYELLCGDDGLREPPLRRADVRAAAAADAFEPVKRLEPGVITLVSRVFQFYRHQMLWTDGEALAAAYALRRLVNLVVPVREDARRGFVDGQVEIIHGEAHHRSAEDHLFRLFGKAARRLYQKRRLGTDRRKEIRRLTYGVSRDGEHAVSKRYAEGDSLGDGDDRREIDDDAARVRRQHF